MVPVAALDTLPDMSEETPERAHPLPPTAGRTAGRTAGQVGQRVDEEQFTAAVVDLLGVLAYGELTGFSRLGADADLSPTLTAKAEMGRLAVVRFQHFERLRRRLEELGVDPEAAMEPFVTAIDAFHERTAPATWLEGLVKAYVGDGISSDFYREISAYVDPATRDLVAVVLQDAGRAEFVVREVRGAIEAEIGRAHV